MNREKVPRGRAAVVAGVGAWLPERAVPNAALTAVLDTSDEWIRERTGIGTRYQAPPGTATSDLAVRAGRLAIESAGHPAVDAVVVATATPDHSCPATAPAVAARLGLTGCPAFDVGAACTGFVYGLATGQGLIAAGTARNVLVIGADTYSTIVDPHDRGVAVIFGDGAGAVLLRAGEAEEPGALHDFDLGSDGEFADYAIVRAGGSHQRGTGPAEAVADHYLALNGRKMFKHAVHRMATSCERVLTRTGWALPEVDLLVPHQANLRIAEGVLNRLGLPAERSFNNIEHVGNTAAASIPVCLADAVRAGALAAGHRTLLTAFGAGLTWGSATLTWPEVVPGHNLPAPITAVRRAADQEEACTSR